VCKQGVKCAQHQCRFTGRRICGSSTTETKYVLEILALSFVCFVVWAMSVGFRSSPKLSDFRNHGDVSPAAADLDESLGVIED
jgi:hypothetical protein